MNSVTKNSETIFALASGSLPTAVAIIKISGTKAFEIAEKIFFPIPEKKRGIYFGEVRDLSSKKVDTGLLLYFQSPQSHTGEDIIEFQCHGSVSVVEKIQNILLFLGARHSEKGEFSYRGYLNGRVSLEELESLGDVFVSQNPDDLDRVYNRKTEYIKAKTDHLKNRLISLQAVLDTAIDFSEEYSAVLSAADKRIQEAIHECSLVTQGYEAFKTGQTVPKIVIVGRPNAGKSSLFNAILGKYRALVHEEAGTTRDVIEEEITIEKRRWKLADTAGRRKAFQKTEIEGIELGDDFLSLSTFWILVVDGSIGLRLEDEEIMNKHSKKPHLIVWNKKDLKNWMAPAKELGAIEISTTSGDGLAQLWEKTQSLVIGLKNINRDPLPSSTQYNRLKSVGKDLEGLKTMLKNGEPPECLAEINRQIMASLDGVFGEVTADEILGRVFSEFCIGK